MKKKFKDLSYFAIIIIKTVVESLIEYNFPTFNCSVATFVGINVTSNFFRFQIYGVIFNNKKPENILSFKTPRSSLYP